MTERQLPRRRVDVRGEGDKVGGDGHQVIPPVRFCRQAIQEDRDCGKPVAPPTLVLNLWHLPVQPVCEHLRVVSLPLPVRTKVALRHRTW
jgi:hypothetical protein